MAEHLISHYQWKWNYIHDIRREQIFLPTRVMSCLKVFVNHYYLIRITLNTYKERWVKHFRIQTYSSLQCEYVCNSNISPLSL